MKIFLDSGAFSAKNKNTEIKIMDYISFIKENIEYIDHYANLDVIGNPEKTWENQKIMEENGLDPLPVYHIGSDIKYLHKCFDYDYFCLGGIAKKELKIRLSFLDRCFNIIPSSKKVHGFGITDPKILLRYPWYSVDSTAYLLFAKFGWILLFLRGKYLIINVSERSGLRKKQGRHFNSFSSLEKEEILFYINNKGFFFEGKEGLRNSFEERAKFNILFFNDLQERISLKKEGKKQFGVQGFLEK